MGNFDEAYLQKSYARAQGKDDETVTIVSRSRQIGRKLKIQKNTAPPPGFNIAPSKYSSITSGLTQEADEYEYVSLLGVSSLALDLAGDNISLLINYYSLISGNVYPPGDASLRVSTATGHTSASKLKQATSLLTQELNATVKK